MFDFFKRRTAEDYKQIAEDVYKVPQVKTSAPKENYRVGATADGMTTLTLMDNALTMTLTLNQAGCEQLIRMLRATYDEEQPMEESIGKTN
jgi:hypothetical protein